MPMSARFPPQKNQSGAILSKPLSVDHSRFRGKSDSPIMAMGSLFRVKSPFGRLRMHLKTIALASAAAFALSVPASAHHSFAMFDASKEVTVQGPVKEF